MNIPPATSFARSPIQVIFVAVIVAMFATTSFAQDGEQRQRPTAVSTTDANGTPRLENNPILPRAGKLDPVQTVSEFASPEMLRFKNSLMGAIDERLGAPYVFGATGPYSYDCSGFVWSAFQEAGISFERASARSLWAKFTPVTDSEKFKFGTLVFFSGIHHVGIVVDEKGFYHASRSHGVTYSPFNEYWLDRVDGFREVKSRAAEQAE